MNETQIKEQNNVVNIIPDEVSDVIYRNELYEYKMLWPSSLSERENKLYAAILACIRDKGGSLVKIRFRDLKKIMDVDPKISNIKMSNMILEMYEKLKRLECSYNTEENKKIEMLLFPTLIRDEQNGIVMVQVNPQFTYLFNNIIDTCKTSGIGYTQFSLIDYYSLESCYSQNLFRILSRYHKLKRYYELPVKKIPELLGCPIDYENKFINSRVVLPAVYRIRKIRGYKKLSVYVRKENRKIISYGFCWSKPGKEIIEGNKYRPLDVIDMDS